MATRYRKVNGQYVPVSELNAQAVESANVGNSPTAEIPLMNQSNPLYAERLALDRANAPLRGQLAAAMESPIRSPEQTALITGLQRQIQAPTPAMRAQPTVATPEQPLVTRGELPTPAKSPEEMLQDIALKKYKNQPLTDDEIRFSFQQEQTRLQPPAPQAPTEGLSFTVEDYMNASPEQQIQMQQQAQQLQNQKQQGFLEQQFGMQEQLLGQREQQQQAAIEAARTAGTQQVAETLAPFKAEQEAQAAEARRQVELQGGKRLEGVKEMQSIAGFGRSTKTMEILDNARADTQAQVANIERQTGRAIADYQASLLDKVNNQIGKLEDRLATTQNQKDALAVDKMKAQSQLLSEMFASDPSNPQNMIKTAEKLQVQKIEQQKLDVAEKKAVRDDAMKNFQFMVGNFGSAYLQNLPPEALQTLAENMGLPATALTNMPKTFKEQEGDWDKLKYFDSQSFQRERDATQNSYQSQRDLNQFNQDIAKIQANLQADMGLEQFKTTAQQQQKSAEAQGLLKALNINYGQYAGGSDGGGLTFDQPVPHPSAKTNVTSLNAAIASAWPDGFRFKDAPGGLVGQCKWFSEKLTDLGGKPWTIGSTAAETKTNLDKFAKSGKAFYPGQEDIKVGQTLITNDSKAFWHSAVVNGITPDGKLVLTESNFKGPLTVSNSRTIDPNDPRIQGILKTTPKKEFAIPGASALAGVAQAGAFGPLGQLPGILGKLIPAGLEAAGKPKAPTAPAGLSQAQLQAIGALPEAQRQLLMTQAPEVYGQYLQQAGTTGAAGKPLPQAAKESLAKVTSAMSNLDKMMARLSAGEGPRYIDPNTPFIGGAIGATPYEVEQKVLVENIGRLQSGGAISQQELVSFNQMMPAAIDPPEVRRYKLQVAKEFLQDKLTAFGQGQAGEAPSSTVKVSYQGQIYEMSPEDAQQALAEGATQL